MPLDPTKIITIMAVKDITRAELSRRTGIAPPHITRLLSGEPRDTVLSTAENIARALRVPVGKLISG